MQRHGFLIEENQLDQRSYNFQKLMFSLLKFYDENNIDKLVVDMWGDCSNRLCQSNFPKFNTFQIFLFGFILEKL